MSQSPKRRAICSSATCTWSGLVDETDYYNGMAKYCARCGSGLMYSCQHCGATIQHHKEPHCMNCGKPLKVQLKVKSEPQAGQKRSLSRKTSKDN